jgi:hypothetical protein
MNWNLGSVSSRGLSLSCDLWIRELEFRKSWDPRSRISKFENLEFRFNHFKV